MLLAGKHSPVAPLFCVSFMVLGSLVIINLFIAVILVRLFRVSMLCDCLVRLFLDLPAELCLAVVLLTLSGGLWSRWPGVRGRRSTLSISKQHSFPVCGRCMRLDTQFDMQQLSRRRHTILAGGK